MESRDQSQEMQNVQANNSLEAPWEVQPLSSIHAM